MKKFSLLFIISFMLFGCDTSLSDTYKRSEITEGIDVVAKKEAASMTYGKTFYEKCKNKYKEIESVSKYAIACESNDVKIELTKDTNTGNLYEVNFKANKDFENNILTFINEILKEGNQKPITLTQLQSVTDANYTTINNNMYNRSAEKDIIDVQMHVNSN